MRLQTIDALHLIEGNDLLEIGSAADAARQEMHPENVVTYVVAAGPESSLSDAVADSLRNGDRDVLLSQIANLPHDSLDALRPLLETLRRSAPGVGFHHLPWNLLHDLEEPAVAGLRDLGIRSLLVSLSPAAALPGAAATLRAAHAAEIPVHIDITIGQGEALSARIDAFASLRALQEQTRAIQALCLRIHRPQTADARREEDATAVDYLKTLGVARLFLDTVPHIQTDWSVMGPKILELALRFGADDAGCVARSQAGREPSHHGGESELRRIIRDAGFRPVERDLSFRQCVLP